MFATLGVLPYDASLRARLRRRFSPPAVGCSRVTLPNFFSFYHLQAPLQSDGSLPWDRIAETAGTLKTRLLLPAGINPPPDAPVRAYTPAMLPLRLLCNSAFHALQGLGLDPLSESLCLVDPQGVLADAVERFLPLTAQLRVVTDDFAAYEKAAATLRLKYGVSLQLAPDIKKASGSTILLLDDAADAPLSYEGLIFTNHPCARPNAQTLTPKSVALPPEYAALCPPGIDPLTFAAAACELCAADELETLWTDCVPQRLTAAAATPADRCCPDWQT